MFVVLASPRTHRDRTTLELNGKARPVVQVSGDVDFSRIAVFTHLSGQRITCTGGRLWVTQENVPGDFELGPGERLVAANDGKLIIGGEGSYSI